jgi:hypothetical protein
MLLHRNPALALLCLPLLSFLAGCNDDDPVLDELIIEEEWVATITETADSCDDVVAPVTDISVIVTDEVEYHLLQFDNLAMENCWVWPFDLAERTLTASHGWVKDHDCNEGCRIEVQSTMTLEVLPGGAFRGTETVTFTPLNAACDHPNCAFPCESQDRHVLFPPFGEGCAFSCQTIFSWNGAVGDDVEKVCD